jgi:hypothetical protein
MVDALGLTIFLIGIVLIVLELSIPGWFIGVGGTALIVVGLIQMSFPDFLFSWWSPFVVVAVVPAAIFVSVQFYKRLAPPDNRPETFSSDRLVGERGKVLVEVMPETTKGKVKIGGIVWSAESDAPIPVGTTVVVLRVEGVHLMVGPVDDAAPPTEDSSLDPEGESIGR